MVAIDFNYPLFNPEDFEDFEDFQGLQDFQSFRELKEFDGSLFAERIEDTETIAPEALLLSGPILPDLEGKISLGNYEPFRLSPKSSSGTSSPESSAHSPTAIPDSAFEQVFLDGGSIRLAENPEVYAQKSAQMPSQTSSFMNAATQSADHYDNSLLFKIANKKEFVPTTTDSLALIDAQLTVPSDEFTNACNPGLETSHSCLDSASDYSLDSHHENAFENVFENAFGNFFKNVFERAFENADNTSSHNELCCQPDQEIYSILGSQSDQSELMSAQPTTQNMFPQFQDFQQTNDSPAVATINYSPVNYVGSLSGKEFYSQADPNAQAFFQMANTNPVNAQMYGPHVLPAVPYYGAQKSSNNANRLQNVHQQVAFPAQNVAFPAQHVHQQVAFPAQHLHQQVAFPAQHLHQQIAFPAQNAPSYYIPNNVHPAGYYVPANMQPYHHTQAMHAGNFIPPTSGSYGSQPATSASVYVPRACTGCKKSHVACDSHRPCNRCVRLNKAHECVDAERKKRGRPPKTGENQDGPTKRSRSN